MGIHIDKDQFTLAYFEFCRDSEWMKDCDISASSNWRDLEELWAKIVARCSSVEKTVPLKDALGLVAFVASGKHQEEITEKSLADKALTTETHPEEIALVKESALAEAAEPPLPAIAPDYDPETNTYANERLAISIVNSFFEDGKNLTASILAARMGKSSFGLIAHVIDNLVEKKKITKVRKQVGTGYFLIPYKEGDAAKKEIALLDKAEANKDRLPAASWLTDKQRDLMNLICDGAYGDDELTMRQASNSVGIADTAIMHVVNGLCETGWLRKERQDDGRTRLFPIGNSDGSAFVAPDKFSSYVDIRA